MSARAFRAPARRAFAFVTTTVALLGSTTARAEEARPEVAKQQEEDRGAVRERPDDDVQPLRIGAIAGIGFPRPLAVEGMIKVDRWAAFGLEYGVLPQSKPFGVDTSMWALSGDARVFPFGGAFYVGLRAGRQHVDASATVSVASLGSATASASIDSWIVNPRIGALWTWRSGFTVGFEAGVQFAVDPVVRTSAPTGVPTDAIASSAASFGKSVLPTVDLLRIGFLF